MRKGAIDANGEQTHKMEEEKAYMKEHKIIFMTLIETDLHGPKSRLIRRTKMSRTLNITIIYRCQAH